jgi:hypothetical protein
LVAAWGYIESEDAETASALLQRILPMLWKLSRR